MRLLSSLLAGLAATTPLVSAIYTVERNIDNQHASPLLAERQATARWPACQDTLACPLSVIQTVPFSDRLIYLVSMQVRHLGGPYRCTNEFKAVEGLLQFFTDKGVGSTYNTTISYATASVMEAIQRGAAIATGRSRDTFNNPASALYGNLIRDIRLGNVFKDRAAHDKAWSRALETALNHGVDLSVRANVRASVNARRWLNFVNVYNILAQNQNVITPIIRLGSIINIVPGLLPSGFTTSGFVNYIFDATNHKPLYCMSDAIWDERAFESVRASLTTILTDVFALGKVVPAMLKCFSAGCS